MVGQMVGQTNQLESFRLGWLDFRIFWNGLLKVRPSERFLEDWTSGTFWNSSWKVEPPFWKGRTFRFSGTALEWLLKERGNVFLLMGHNTPNPILGWTFRSSGMTLERSSGMALERLDFQIFWNGP
ncbi:unnamed protein product [Rhizophagus irregularis]|nr:unnamed protein product [Rhizophagus irregularis]